MPAGHPSHHLIHPIAMDAPTYDQIAEVIDQSISRRGITGDSMEAHITRSTLAICKLESAADLIRLLLDDDLRALYADRAVQFLESLTTGEP